MKKIFTIVAAVLALYSTSVSAQSYKVVPLGEPPGQSPLLASNALSLNNTMRIVGSYQFQGSLNKAFYYQNGVMTPIINSNYYQSQLRDINAAGLAVGWARLQNQTYSGITFDGVTVNELTLIPGTGVMPRSINNQGIIAGSKDHANRTRAFRYSNGQTEILPHIANAFQNSNMWAHDMNNNNFVVGYTSAPMGEQGYRAFVNDTVDSIDIGTLQNKLNSKANAINDSGYVVGESYNTKTYPAADGRAFVYSNGVMSELGTLDNSTNCNASDINENNLIVGWCEVNIQPGVQARAVLFVNGKAVDLNTLIDSGSGWVLNWAEGINKYGDIVGRGTFNNSQRAFLLTANCPTCPVQKIPVR